MEVRMNKKILFVAEADKIQDLLFRSSKLREVAGGSQMLSEFCEDAVSRLIKEKSEYLFCWNDIQGNDSDRFIGFLENEFGIDWIKTGKIEKINDGRTIRIYFENKFLSLTLNEEKTKGYLKIDDGRTDEYIVKQENSKLKIFKGGRVLISGGGSFRILFESKGKAEEFGEYLSEFYRRELGGMITIAELVEVDSEKDAINLAQERLIKAKHNGKLPQSLEHMPYMAICASCGIGLARYHKKRFDERENYLCDVCENKSKARIKDRFLSEFITNISNSEKYEPPEDVDVIAKLDPKNYVAYIVADVNNMGKIFSSCDSFDKLKNLSDTLDKVIIQSLAKPTKLLIQKQKEVIKPSNNSKLIPVLPLILGGDDVFALIPAKCALNFTMRFSQEFESIMKKSLETIGISSSMSPTISSAVIICKKNFPYQIAHNIGEELLRTAKKTAKEEKKSTISFKVLTGNEIVKAPEKERTFVAGFPAYSIEELKTIIDYRWNLKNLPGTRRAQLGSLYQKAEKLQNDTKETVYEIMKSKWIPNLEHILSRFEDQSNIVSLLEDLGDPDEEGYWIRKENIYYHELPDLLHAWNFAYDIEKDWSKYEGVES